MGYELALLTHFSKAWMMKLYKSKAQFHHLTVYFFCDNIIF